MTRAHERTSDVTVEVSVRVRIKANSLSALDDMFRELRLTKTVYANEGGTVKMLPVIITRNDLRDRWLAKAQALRSILKVRKKPVS